MNAPKQKRKAFANYTPTARDVIVATYAKSGTNWAMQIALQIAYYGEAEFSFIHDLVPWPDTPMPVIKAKLKDKTLAQKAPTGLRVIKTHWERPYVPYTPEAKYLVVLRDPKEVFVSGYFFAHSMFSATLQFDYTADEWLDLFTSEKYIFGSWAEHTASWWACRNHENVLILHYGEMKRDPIANIERVAKLLDVSLTTAQLEKVAYKSDFAYMKTHETQFAPPVPSLRNTKLVGTLIRSGAAGMSEELIESQKQAIIDRFCQAELKRLGSDFPYTDYFMKNG
jgi:hypothetical protein